MADVMIDARTFLDRTSVCVPQATNRCMDSV